MGGRCHAGDKPRVLPALERRSPRRPYRALGKGGPIEPSAGRTRLAGAVAVAAVVLGGWAVMRVSGQHFPQPLPSPAEIRHPVFVYLLAEEEDVYEAASYDPVARPSHGARGAEERLRTALRELVKGPTDAELEAGYMSTFSPPTAAIVDDVELRGGRAIVTFADFRTLLPQASTTNGGSVFLMQLNQTVFEFEGVESVEYRIGDSCAEFWEFLQAGGCEITHRDGSRMLRR